MIEKRKILILDDEGSIRDLLKEVLEGAGYEVITSGNPGITAVRAYRADAIVLDLHMARSNEMHGLDVLIHLWEDKQLKIPILIFSAYAGFDETVKEIGEIEKTYGEGRRVHASVSKADGIDMLLSAIDSLFNER